MKVLFQSRKTLFSVPGGDTVQIIKTAEYLRALGVHVDVSTDLEPDLTAYDMVHLFNLMRPQEIFIQATNAKAQGKRLVLSTIYGLYTEYERKARSGLAGSVIRKLSPWQAERLKVIARAFANYEMNKGVAYVAYFGYRNLCLRTAEMIDVFLPNSMSEMRRVYADFDTAEGKPFVVVPNAVDTSVFDPDRTYIDEKVKQYEGCVLSVARIEGRKCQLELVRAMKDLPYQLVLIGMPAPNHFSYFKKIKKEAGDRVTFLGQVPHSELAQYYKVAKVHALISWMETPGLSSLEAGVMGCNLVITDKGDTKDYFGDEAYYCEPDLVDSIRYSIVRAYEASPKTTFAQRIRDNFNWQKTAEKTIEGYQIAMAK